jgi:putative ABC transport system permease protein
MYFLSYCMQNVLNRKVRALLTIATIAIAIGTVVTMGVLTESLRQSAISILQMGTSDFSIAQKDQSDLIYSSIDEKELTAIRAMPGVQNAVGALVSPVKLDDDHPFFLRVGVPPDQLDNFGVKIVAGQAYGATAPDEILLGYRTAHDFAKAVGDTFTIRDDSYKVVGIYNTGQVFADQAVMFPLVSLQAIDRKPATITLAFVKVKPGVNIDQLRSQIERDYPELATVRTQSDFGRVDRNLALLSAANTGVSALALVIGAITVMNAMVLAVFERTREFGVLRAIGWAKIRILLAVLIEALFLGLAGAAVGVAIAFIAVPILQKSPELVGVFQPRYSSAVFGRALLITLALAFFGAIYPAIRAALLRPIEAIRHE